MDGKRPNADYLGCLHSSEHGIPQERAFHALLLPVFINGKARQQHNRHRMPRKPLPQSFRRIVILYLTGSQAVVPNYNFANQTNISLSRAGSLILQRVLPQPLTPHPPPSKTSRRSPATSSRSQSAGAHLAHAPDRRHVPNRWPSSRSRESRPAQNKSNRSPRSP